jgi:trk system potassium uptake protein TrkA
MVAALANPHLTDIFELGGDAEIVEIEVPPSFVGQSLKDLGLRKRFQFQVAALRRRKDEAGSTVLVTEIPPDPERPLKRDERMLIIGEHRHLTEFIERLPGL